jgi:hypothetical protein
MERMREKAGSVGFGLLLKLLKRQGQELLGLP